MSNDEGFLTEQAMFKLIAALAEEAATHGSNEADLLNRKGISDGDLETIMKANTFLSTFVAVLIQIVEKQTPGFAKMVLDVWTSEQIQGLVKVAFSEEITEALQTLERGIQDIEKEINKEV